MTSDIQFLLHYWENELPQYLPEVRHKIETSNTEEIRKILDKIISKTTESSTFYHLLVAGLDSLPQRYKKYYM